MKTLTLISLLLLASCKVGYVTKKEYHPQEAINFNGMVFVTPPNEYLVTINTIRGKERTYFVPGDIADTLQVGDFFRTFDIVKISE